MSAPAVHTYRVEFACDSERLAEHFSQTCWQTCWACYLARYERPLWLARDNHCRPQHAHHSVLCLSAGTRLGCHNGRAARRENRLRPALAGAPFRLERGGVAASCNTYETCDSRPRLARGLLCHAAADAAPVPVLAGGHARCSANHIHQPTRFWHGTGGSGA